MNDQTLALTLVRHRDRLREIGEVVARFGLADWVSRSKGLDEVTSMTGLVTRKADPMLATMSQGERLRGALVELGTTWVKFGQMLSLRSDLVGDEVARELTKLQAEVPADPPGVARACVEAELGGSTDELYASFEVEPFASGSVAQVHHATLTDGTEVVVKVVHDGADRKVLEDLDLMRAVARYVESNDPELAQFRPTILVDEFAQMMQSAVDLSQELDNLQRFTANFAGEPDVVIPTGYPDRSSRRVLTMSLIQGTTLEDRGTIEATGWDVDTLVKRATELYLEMIFRDGIYHADPHPGNFLLPDGEHMAILDFGDVGRLSTQRRLQLESLVIAVVAKDVDELTDVILELTSPPPGVDLPKLRSDIDAWMNRYLLAGVAQLDMAGIVNSGMALMHTHRLVLPADLALLFRVLLRLQGLGRGIDADVQVAELLRPYVEQMASERFDPRRMVHRAARTARSWEHLVADLPEELHAILEQIRTGDLGVDFRIHDSDGGIDRIVDGLLASASVLASAQLLSRRAGPTIGGVSLPGLVAVGVGVITWQRLAAKRAGRRSMLSRARRLATVRNT